MEKKICFISASVKNYSSIKYQDYSKIITFDYTSHKNLHQLGIKHLMAENFLNYDERLWIFDIVKKFQNWHNNSSSFKIFELEGINLLGLIDGIELHTFLMQKLIIFCTIKKIIESEKPNFIEYPFEMNDIIQLLEKNNHINFKINSDVKQNKLFWDSINVKHNVGNIPISMKISRTKYNKLKNIVDKTVSSTFGLWFDFKNKNKKTILLLELFPPLYEELINNLSNDENNVIIINRRRPVTLDRNSIRILKNSNCKLISKESLMEKADEKKISKFQQEYLEKLSQIWSHNEYFDEIFKINNISFWPIIRDDLKQVYQKRIGEYVEEVIFAKKIFEKINIKCILSLYDVGETEKIFLNCKNVNVSSFLLEHGFSLFFDESKRFGTLSSYDTFMDKIILWSEHQKEFLISNFNIEANRIYAIGSPRHDKLKKIEGKSMNNDTLSVLIAPTPITQLQGFDTTENHEKFEKLVERLCKIFQEKYPKVNLVFKIHPSQSDHNDEIKEIIQKYSKKPQIHFLTPVLDLIQSSDLIITITPEGWAPSTIVLESMSLGKPTMNIILDQKFLPFQYVNQNAILAISDDSNLESNIDKILFDGEFRQKLSTNGKNFAVNFLNNFGSASKKLANVLKEECASKG